MGKQFEHSRLATSAKTGSGRRAIDNKLAKIIENPKSVLLLRGHSTSAIGVAVLNDLNLLKKPLARKLQRKNDILPFEAGGEVHLENLARLNDCSLFAMTNHTKKRPHNLILGRTFGFRILDMFEFGITNYTPMASFPMVKSAPGSKPLLLFNGGDYDKSATTKSLRSLLLDMFRGPDDVEALNLAGVDHIIVFTLNGESKVSFRHYAVNLLVAADSTLPKVGLTEAGPRFDLEIRRVQMASDEHMRAAMKKAKDPKAVRKVKNVSRDELGDKKGRIHVGRQDLTGLALARMKGLNKKRGHTGPDDGDDGDDGSNVEAEGNGLEDGNSEENAEQGTAKRRKVDDLEAISE